MTRLHPQDLRAIVVAICSCTENAIQDWTEPIKEADALLAHLKRTAYPERDWCDRCQTTHASGEDHTRPPVERMADNKALRAERDALKAELDTLKEAHKVCGNLVPEIQRQERERIIALLAEIGYLSYEVRSAIEQGEKK